MAPGRTATAPTWRDAPLLLPLLLAALAAAGGRSATAAVLAVVGVALLVARAAFGERVHQVVGRVGAAAQRALTWLVLSVFWLVVVVPAWAVGSMGRRGRHREPATHWAATGAAATARRSFATPSAPTVRAGSRLLRAIGLVVVLLVLDASVGLGWEWFTRSGTAAPVARRLGLARNGTHHDPRADSPALRDDPWADAHLRDMQRLPQAYWPYVLDRPLPFHSATVTVTGWERRSYEPAAVRAGGGRDLPLVAFFGGSTTFGEGQRDEHTIPSEVARIAEAAGTPIRVVNYGQRSWTAWQEALLFEQLSSHPDSPDTPDIVVFYDGSNDVSWQQQDSTAGWPTHYDVDGVARILSGGRAGQGGRTNGFEADSVPHQAVGWYSSHSMVLRGLRGLRDKVGLGPDPTPPEVSSATPEAVGRRAATVYVRARTFVQTTAAARGIDAVLYWQPVPHWRTDRAFATATERIGTGSIVVSDALDDHQDDYFDEVHTNEAGARIVAERLWQTLRERVDRVR